MKGYKAFEKGMICRGKQYAENTDFEEDRAVLCGCGMHFCKSPLGVLEYYPLVDDDGNMTEFAEVEAPDDDVIDDGKDKCCTKKLHIGAKVSFAQLVQAEVEFDKETILKNENKNDSAKIGSSGDSAKINSEGEDAVICCAGHGSIVKAKVGSWFTLSEWIYDENKGRIIPNCVKTFYVDGETVKADTWYKLVNCELVEVSK